MKAKEYFEKYKARISVDDGDASYNAALDICSDMYGEVKELIKIRNVSTDAGLVAIVREMNQKWNALKRIFEKNKIPILKQDGFKIYFESVVDTKVGED